MQFTEEEIERYSRQIILKEVGGKGQRKLLDSRVLIAGAGGLGSPAALYLAAAGVGAIGLADGDNVELSNLQRQIVHHTPDVGRPKVDSAVSKLKELNPGVNFHTHPRLTSDNVLDIMRGYDLVIDGTDTFPSKYLINDSAVIARKPLVHGGILRFTGQVLSVKPYSSACLRCVFPEPPPPGEIPTCQEAGILGAVAGIVGSIQAAEALKLLLGIGEPLVGKMLVMDILTMRMRIVEIKRDEGCPLCGNEPSIHKVEELQQACQA